MSIAQACAELLGRASEVSDAASSGWGRQAIAAYLCLRLLLSALRLARALRRLLGSVDGFLGHVLQARAALLHLLQLAFKLL